MGSLARTAKGVGPLEITRKVHSILQSLGQLPLEKKKGSIHERLKARREE